MIVYIIAAAALIAGLSYIIDKLTPEGWQGEGGFHYGHNPEDDA